MPVTPTYPGVYIEELPSGVRTITGVATSITAFVGRARRGPVNEPVTINSFGDFDRSFGGLWPAGAMSYAVRDFYLNGGVQAVIVRLFHPMFADDTERASANQAAEAVADAVTAAAQNAGTNLNVSRDSLTLAAATAAETYKGETAAEYNAAMCVASSAKGAPAGTSRQFVKSAARDKANDSSNKDEPRKSAAGRVAKAAEQAAFPVKATARDVMLAAFAESDKVSAEADAAKAAANDVLAVVNAAAAGATVDAVKQAARDQANDNSNKDEPRKGAADKVAAATENAASQTGATVATLKAAASAEAVSVAAEADARKDAALGVAQAARTEEIKDLSAVEAAAADAVAAAAPQPTALISGGGLSLAAASPGAWGNELRARVDCDVPAQMNGFQSSDLFNLTVRDGVTGVTEVFRNLTIKDGPRQVDRVLKNESRLVRWNGPLASVPAANADAASGQDPWGDTANINYRVTEKGSDGGGLGEGDFTASGEGSKKGLYALEQADLFNLLAIPPYKAGDVDATLVGSAAAFCEKRRAMLIVDPPSAWTSKDQAKGVAAIGTSSRNAAVFFPRLRQPDPMRGGMVGDFAPCGAVAGVFARTDAMRGVWKAPAGLEATLVNVPELSVSLTDMENGELNQLGVNCLRVVPAAGRVIWGARTLEGNDRLASQWKYIPVRRTALYIEESLYRGTQWVVFEPNAEPLWAQIRLNIGAFMNNLFRQSAFAGVTPRDAYFVKCDRETTTQNDVNLGIVNIVVGFAPLKPAEFVIIQIQQMAGQTAA